MSRKFIALIAGTAIALTTFSAPARADSDDAAKALAALLGLVVVGKIISDRNDDKRYNVHKAPRPIQPGPKPRPLPPQVNKKLLPQHCFRTFNAQHRQVRGFGAYCLQRNYRFAHTLPRRCAVQVQTRRGWGWAYGARCLNERGYRLARH